MLKEITKKEWDKIDLSLPIFFKSSFAETIATAVKANLR